MSLWENHNQYVIVQPNSGPPFVVNVKSGRRLHRHEIETHLAERFRLDLNVDNIVFVREPEDEIVV